MSDQDEQAEKKQIPLTELVALLDKLKENSEEDNNIQYNEEHIERLKNAYRQLKNSSEFKVGQLVKWKKNLKNRKIPRENQPAIVLEILETPIINEEAGIGNPYFRERIDFVLGVLEPNNMFFAFHYDSRRFEPFESK
jgi:hypothetical protein